GGAAERSKKTWMAAPLLGRTSGLRWEEVHLRLQRATDPARRGTVVHLPSRRKVCREVGVHLRPNRGRGRQRHLLLVLPQGFRRVQVESGSRRTICYSRRQPRSWFLGVHCRSARPSLLSFVVRRG